MKIETLEGPNFSGRSAALKKYLLSRSDGQGSFFIGPYTEGALSGLSGRVGDEIALYRRHPEVARDLDFAPVDFSQFLDRRPSTLSGGEQVILALHCFAGSQYRSAGIDTALEQLDAENRDTAFGFLQEMAAVKRSSIVVDNKLPLDLDRVQLQLLDFQEAPFPLDLDGLVNQVTECKAPSIQVRRLSFAYTEGNPVLLDVSITLEAGRAYRLVGRNGSGKTTFLKLITGVLPAANDALWFDAKIENPRRTGNAIIALASQNPDSQWCGATIREDLRRRFNALPVSRFAPRRQAGEIIAAVANFGLDAISDHNLYELPIALRKRLTWLWPLSGTLPWLALDEPTLGQDAATRHILARALCAMCARGYGVIFVTHDNSFASLVPHQSLLFEDRRINQVAMR